MVQNLIEIFQRFPREDDYELVFVSLLYMFGSEYIIMQSFMSSRSTTTLFVFTHIRWMWKFSKDNLFFRDSCVVT